MVQDKNIVHLYVLEETMSMSCCVLQLSPQVVQDGAAKATEAEEECSGLPGELLNATAQSGVPNCAKLQWNQLECFFENKDI